MSKELKEVKYLQRNISMGFTILEIKDQKEKIQREGSITTKQTWIMILLFCFVVFLNKEVLKNNIQFLKKKKEVSSP